ncbi:MAG: DUF4835 family protein [Prevotella sp.]|nr:DUF4835 family protein [Prevotella sp.]
MSWKYVALVVACLLSGITLEAQELNARIKVNHAQIQGTDVSVFKDLEDNLTRFVNQRQWTSLQFRKNERIACTFNITVTKYDQSSNRFTARCLIQASRPVYGSIYNTTLYSNTDNEFNFDYAQFDQLQYNDESVDNQLTALFAYYAYLIIGMDLDSFALNAGQDVLQRCMNLVTNAQNLNFTGWKSFDNDRNRFAIINDYLDGAMAPFRKLQYDYYRNGLDQMSTNAERGRTNISTAIEEDLKKCHTDKPLSQLPLIWTDYKRDEIANIYQGKGTPKEKDKVYEILFGINAAQSNAWNKIKE